MNPMVEIIFSHAVSLSQSGRLRNEIYCQGSIIYIANFDNTILLQFHLPFSQFKEEISFEANDYDSENFRVENDQILFLKEEGPFVREKICGKTGRTFSEIEGLFEKYFDQITLDDCNIVNLHNSLLSLLDENLSHVEVSSQNKKFLIIQRDIYTGGRIEIQENKKGFHSLHQIQENFGPIGLRTNDLFAMFTFTENLKFYFRQHNDYCLLTGEMKLGSANKIDMKGIIAGCIYDEMGTVEIIKEENINGRQKQEGRGSEQKIDTTLNSGEGQPRRERPKTEEQTSQTRTRRRFLQ